MDRPPAISYLPREDRRRKIIDARAVVLATGAFQRPAISRQLSPEMLQLLAKACGVERVFPHDFGGNGGTAKHAKHR